ncbi:TPA: ribonuclease E/G [Haemophilus influenzae]
MDAVELLMNVTPNETRIALVETGMLREVHIERQAKRGIVGNIYKGRVTRVLPGMQSAFVDIGLEKAAFLHAADIVSHTECVDENEQKQFKVKSISELVREGQDIVVQVVKDPLGTKGARLTTDITLPSRHLVFMPENSHVGVSQRIESEEELRQDAEFLKRLWRKVLERKSKYPTKSKIYGEPALPQRILRDFIGTNLEKIRIDSKLCFGEVKEFTDEFMPELSDKLVLYSGNQPIFDVYGVENAIQTALDKRVNLKSGGYLIIEQTEAMTTIDINTGAFVGHRNLEETIFNTNIEATKAIAQQLQLRNLGGIIIIDFIDMQTDEHRNRVLESLCDVLSKDRVKTNVNGFTQLGLVEMTRKRTRESLEHVLCDECPTCHGRGRVKTVETVCYEIMREIIRVYHLFSSEQFVVYASPAVSEYLINEESHGLLPEVEMFIGKRVQVKTEQFYNQEQFDVVVM